MVDSDFFYLFVGFAGLVTVASLWNMWGGDMFPAEKDPSGGTSLIILICCHFTTGQMSERPADKNCSATDPEYWTDTELKRWLRSVSASISTFRPLASRLQCCGKAHHKLTEYACSETSQPTRN